VNLPLSEVRLSLFLEGRRLFKGRTSCAGEEKMKEKDYRRRVFYGPRRR
jgi:hypothetical protein